MILISYILLCGNNALKYKTIHQTTAYYVYVLIYNAAKQTSHCIKSYSNLSSNIQAYISNYLFTFFLHFLVILHEQFTTW
jgi:hypothetical protein